MENRPLDKAVKILPLGITDVKADCVVNAANEGLWAGGGVCGAIFRAAGAAQLTAACNKIGGCKTGDAVITPAFQLDAKYIIHAVGPVYTDGKHGEPSQLYDCYKRSLELAMEHDCHSIVFPVISAGIFGYPKEGAWRKAIRACHNFIHKNPGYDIAIYFAVPDAGMRMIGEKTIAAIAAEDPKTGHHAAPEAASGRHADRAERVKIFEDTQRWIQESTALSAAVAAAKKATEIFYEDHSPAYDGSAVKEQMVTVTRDRSFQAAMRLKKQNPNARIAVMNFANAFHPGGGVTKGASAQEECLCRCSTLYPVLNRRYLNEKFYQYHKDLNSSKASDTLVYSPNIVVCKTDTGCPQRMSEKDWETVDVITVAAPDLREKSNRYAELVGNGTYMTDEELYECHTKRARHVLAAAAHKGVDILVLGAFGCGAFRNDPQVVARAYRDVLQEFPKVFSKIEFAVYCSPADEKNYTVFKDILT